MPVYRLNSDLLFPHPELADPDGLLAVGGDLSSPRLLLAYSYGIFPWYGQGEEILWWSPDPRAVLPPAKMHRSRSLRKVIRQRRFTITFDQAFGEVIENCACNPRPGRQSTWITEEMLEAYCRLHREGFAHSVEAWRGDRLAGGLYGVSLGRMFFGESMFSLVSDASKVALSALCRQLEKWDFAPIDCQIPNKHLSSLGARNIPRNRFLRTLQPSLQHPTRKGPWRVAGS